MKPLVSILCITYNQKRFIKQTIDSFLEQKTDFPFEILVHDDASTDGTTEILKEYADMHPGIFRLFLEKENQYSKRNFRFIKDMYIAAKGKYIATCEGDDFWTDPTKLQRQVDFLDKHQDYALVFHPVRVFYENGEQEDSIFPDIKSDFTVKRLLQGNFIQTNSVVYRARGNYKDMEYDVVPGDWYTHLYHAQSGKIGFIDRVMSAYRRHEGGVWWTDESSKQGAFLKRVIYGHLRLADEMKKMFVKDKNLYAEAVTFIRKLINETIIYNKDDTEFTKGLIGKVPGVASDIIIANHEEIEGLKGEVESLKVMNQTIDEENNRLAIELATIKSSRSWRVVSLLRKYKARLLRK